MEDRKIISFAGVKREDVVYYISKLLATFDEPVLVVDNSEQQGVFKSVHHKDENDEIYVKNIAFHCVGGSKTLLSGKVLHSFTCSALSNPFCSSLLFFPSRV